MPKRIPRLEHLVLLGDCRDIVPTLDKFDFVFADPPFNLGQDYSGYNDNIPSWDYAAFMNEWLCVCWKACSGVMALHGPDELVFPYLNWASSNNAKRIGWVNWHYRFGQCSRSNWIDARCHCLIYSNKEQYTWNPEEVLVESDRATVYGDKRVDETERGGKRLPGTVWGIPSDGPYWGRVQGGNKERVPNRPNQLPEVYLERLLRAYTNPGDRVLDPFGGTGTTITVAHALGRSCVTCDISQDSITCVKERLKKGAIRVRG